MKIIHQFAYFEDEILSILEVTRGTFGQSIKPLMVAAGHCRKDESKAKSPWVYDGSVMWQWKVYIATRKNLIKADIWSSKRPYSIEEMEAIAIEGWYDEYQPE